MVLIITGAAESGRDTVGRLLAEALGWEFFDAENLRAPRDLNTHICAASANADPALCMETLSAAITFWLYEWRDAVISCPMLIEGDRRKLSEMSSLVKVVCLEASHAIGRTPVLDRVGEIVAEMIGKTRAVLIN